MKLLLYCTKSKKQLFFDKIKQMFMFGLNGKNDKFNSLNGKIVAECDFEVEGIFGISRGTNQPDKYDFKWEDRILNGACLTNDQMNDYIPNYAIHIKNLHIFDKPRDIRNYYNIAPRTMQDCMNQKALVKAPQNMCNAYDVYKNHYIVISIRPEWLCKILNGEKTIEIRKKVLKEMIR